MFLLPCVVPVAPPPVAMAWLPAERRLPAAVTDGNPRTYEIVALSAAQMPASFGLSWEGLVPVGTFIVSFACLGGRSFEPDFRSTRVEAYLDGRWQPLRADLHMDRSREGELAPLQKRGTARWTFRFRPVKTQKIRLHAAASAHQDLGYQCVALVDLQAMAGGIETPTGAVTVRGAAREPWAMLDQGTDLAGAPLGATVVERNPWVIRWPAPVLISSVTVSRPASIISVEWSADGEWRPVDNLLIEGSRATFGPLSVEGVRIHTDRPTAARPTVSLGPEARDYFASVESGCTDILGERFRSSPIRDLAAMDSLLLPINFTKTAIGRPADLVETIVMWNGTFLQLAYEPCLDPVTGQALPAQTVERWVAPAPGGALPAWPRTQSSYLDGWMPAVVSAYDLGAIRAQQTLFVTGPQAAVYGTVGLVTLRNTTAQRQKYRFVYALGRRRLYGDPATPFLSDPLDTGYKLDSDRQTVRTATGEVTLYAFQPGRWGGTDRERHLIFTGTLEPQEARSLAIFVPDVTQPLRDTAGLQSQRPEALLAGFREYWSGLMKQAALVETPEPRINNAIRNLIAQCLIIGLDGDVARYGAYHYEAYFGLEEGWPAVALAQFGFADYARRIMDFMLSPACLDKTNYHHQYRNGLAPWYAADVARLAPDTEWLRAKAPTLKACAEWTIAQIEANQDSRWGGILPRHVYGGDIGIPAFSFYANATCWRGLHDTATLMRILGEEETATKYRAAADKYRRRLIELADQLVDQSGSPPFLPMSFGLIQDGKERDREPAYGRLAADVPYSDIWTYLGNYWNLFAPCFQELRLFPVTDPRSRWVPDYMQARGGILAGQVRFANGLDAVYGKGYIQSLLDHGQRDEFVTSLYGMFSAAMSRNLFSGPEVSGVFSLRTDNRTLASEYARQEWFWPYRYGGAWAQGWQNQEGEPLAAVAGMALQIIRSALVREDYAEDPPRDLRLLDGVPRDWLEPGKPIVARDMQTFFGVVSIEVATTPAGATVRVTLSPGFSARRVLLRLPSPDGKPISSVRIDGRPAEPLSADEVAIAPRPGVTEVHVRWQ